MGLLSAIIMTLYIGGCVTSGQQNRYEPRDSNSGYYHRQPEPSLTVPPAATRPTQQDRPVTPAATRPTQQDRPVAPAAARQTQPDLPGNPTATRPTQSDRPETSAPTTPSRPDSPTRQTSTTTSSDSSGRLDAPKGKDQYIEEPGPNNKSQKRVRR